jgi:choline kinase
MTVKAIILAAGRGSRMGALTDEKPKCLNKVGGKALLEHQMEALRSGGVSDIAAVTGYKQELLHPLVPHHFENPRWAQTNMVRSLQCADAWLSTSRCIVSYSDIFYEPVAVTALAADSGDICITYDVNWLEQWSLRFEDPLSDAERFEISPEGFVTTIGGRASSVSEIKGQYMGLLAFNPAGWATIQNYLNQRPPEEVDRLDMTGMLSRLIAQGVKIRGIPYSGRWGEVDSATDLAMYENGASV